MDQPERTHETERRRATILFADLTGFTSFVEKAGVEDAYSVVTECLRLLDVVARRHGASVDKYLGDCVMAVFGVPRAIENAPRAAVNAAIEMLDAVRAYASRAGQPLGIHIGIDTGSVVSGDVSGPVLREFAVMGDAVNLAARLKDLAPVGEVYVGPETWRATRSDFEYRGHAPIPIKGKEHPVAVYELRSRERHIHKPRTGTGEIGSALVGRERELAALRAAVAELAADRGGVFSLVAEAGVGKSRLLDELVASPEAADTLVFQGRSLSIGRELGFHPFVDLLRGWIGLRSEVDEGSARERLAGALEAALGDDAAQALPFLAALVAAPLSAEERARLDAMGGEGRTALTVHAVERVLSELARQHPLVLVFDDLHWADASSVELLERLIASPLLADELFVLAFRPGFDDTSERVRRAAEAARGDAHRVLELHPLARADAAILLDNLLGHAAPEPLRGRVIAKTQGNPFFTEEVVRSLLESGSLVRRGGRLVATEYSATAVIPGTVQEVIMARIDHLPPVKRHVLEAAAVIGARFAVPVLAELAGKDSLDELLAEFESAGLIVRGDEHMGVPHAAFKHPLIQEVAYGTLLRARQRELHGKAAAAIESLLSDRVPGFHAMLAWHYVSAEDSARAEEYLFRAGEEATRAAASSEALAFFRRAAELYCSVHGEGGDPIKRAALERNVAIASFNRGELADAVDHFTNALALYGEQPARDGAAGWIGFARDLAVVAAGLRTGAWRRRRPPATPEQRQIVDLRFRRCLSQTTTSPQFVFDTLATLRWLARIDPSSVPEAGGVYAGAVGVFSWGGISFSLGERILELAREVESRSEVRELRLYARLMEFIHYYLAGDWSDAHAVDDETVEEGERYGRLWEVQTWLDIDAERRLYQGRLDLAALRIDELAAFAARYDHDVGRGASRYRAAELALETRDLDAAREGLELYHAQHADPSLRIVALAARIKTEVLAGRLDEAARLVALMDEVEKAAGLMAPFYRVRAGAARLLHSAAAIEGAAGAGARAHSLVRNARREARAAQRAARRVAAFRPEVWRASGTIAWLVGRHAAALAAWKRGLDSAAALGAQSEQARLHAEIARRLAESRGPNALAALEAAAPRVAAHAQYVALGRERELAELEAQRP